jgi:L-cystine uptake protein TcyP (sodium:dicarboxylate symporter family)
MVTLDRWPSKLTSSSFSCAALSRISSSMIVLAPLFSVSIRSHLHRTRLQKNEFHLIRMRWVRLNCLFLMSVVSALMAATATAPLGFSASHLQQQRYIGAGRCGIRKRKETKNN